MVEWPDKDRNVVYQAQFAPLVSCEGADGICILRTIPRRNRPEATATES